MRYLPLTDVDRAGMLAAVAVPSVEALFADVPAAARHAPAGLPPHQGEIEVERDLAALAARNRAAGAGPFFCGAGAYRHHVPASVDHLIQRSEFLTSYTPYQPEIAQGTLQVLFEFQTQVAELTGMEVANASMYDGSTAAAEAVLMAARVTRRHKAVLSGGLHPHYAGTIATLAQGPGLEIERRPLAVDAEADVLPIDAETACVVVQSPNLFGTVSDLSAIAEAAHAAGALLVVVVTEAVSLGLLNPPGAMGADIVAAEGQSIGNPLSFGGPYVGLFAAREALLRQMPGRLCGQTVDADGRRGFVLTLSAREQHIRREKATSNICTNSGLCALAFSIHMSLLGGAGLRRLAFLNHQAARRLKAAMDEVTGVKVLTPRFFNEIAVELARLRRARGRGPGRARRPRRRAGLQARSGRRSGPRPAAGGDRAHHGRRHRRAPGRPSRGAGMSALNVGRPTRPEGPSSGAAPSGGRGLLQDEPLLFEQDRWDKTGVDLPGPELDAADLEGLVRETPVALPGLSEPEAVRHYVRLSQKNHAIDLAMYPLGSCTMKHNPRLDEKLARLAGFADIHPLQPVSTVQGALDLMGQLGDWLAALTGMPAVALSPKAGADGELCGLLAIRAAHEARGDARRRVLVPVSAHGTNPATAAMAGYAVDEIAQTDDGRVDLTDLQAGLGSDVAAVMITNPNTCGLFERDMIEVARLTHAAGAYLYCDGANFNAIVGKVMPGALGVDAMHLNLHKTFSTPHGGGGPGAGPVVFSEALAPFAPLPRLVRAKNGWSLQETAEGEAAQAFGRLCAFQGQMGMFVRALAYMKSHGADGLRQVAEDAVLNANYVRVGLNDLLTQAFDGPCMHEALFDDRWLEGTGLSTLDIAKALIDAGFHPMTMYFPLVAHGAMLIEPTETEPRAELDRFIAALRRIAEQAKAGQGEGFKTAPHLAPLSPPRRDPGGPEAAPEVAGSILVWWIRSSHDDGGSRSCELLILKPH